MNVYIKGQISNMIEMSKTFEYACELAALQDDGVIDRTEQKQLKKIKIAAQKFRKELENIK